MVRTLPKIYLFLGLFLLPGLAAAQLEIDSPIVAGVSLKTADDYATQVLNDAWDMDRDEDVSRFITDADFGAGITSSSVSGGNFNFTIASADGAFFHMLSPGQCSSNPRGKNGQEYPIDSTKYRYLTVTMYTTAASEFRVLWYTGCNYSNNWVRTVPVTTTVGWQTFTMDLQTIGVGSSLNPAGAWNAAPVTGLRIDPGYSGNVSIAHISLSGTPPVSDQSHTVDYTFTSAGNDTRYSLFVDDDTNPFNGYVNDIKNSQTTDPALTIESDDYAPGVYYLNGFASDDFATLQGNPWDLNESSDVSTTTPSAFSSYSVAGGQLNAQTGTSGSALLFFNMASTTFPANVFKCISYDLTLPPGTAFNLIWQRSGVFGYGFKALNSSNMGDFAVDLSGQGSWTGDITAIGFEFTTSNTPITLKWGSIRQNACGSPETLPTIEVSPGTLTINQAPHLTILQPDNHGGADFASSVLGNPWSFDGVDDIEGLENLATAEILPGNTIDGAYGNYFHGANISGNGDPYQFNLDETRPNKNPGRLIDSSRYKNLWAKFYVARDQDVVNGSLLRIIWQSQTGGDTVPKNGDDTFYGNDWQEIVQDMTTIELEELLHPTTPAPYWTGMINVFRLDMHEFTTTTDYYLDFVRLTADDEGNTSFMLAYDLSDPDSDVANIDVDFYYNTTKSTTGGVLFASVSGGDETRVVEFDTSGLANGTYYIYAIADDGLNTTTRLASGRLVVDHTRAQDTTAPLLGVELPTTGLNFAGTLRVRGYAVDNIQTALVEVLLDGDLLGTIVPSMYNKTAHETYGTYAEADTAGFDTDFDTSGIAMGAHTLVVNAYDTGGNMATSSISITRAVTGDNPSVAAYPEMSALQVTGAQPLSLKAKVKNKKTKKGTVKTLSLTMGGSSACNGQAMKLYASTKKATLEGDFELGALVPSKAALSDKVFTAPLKKSTKKKMFLRLACGMKTSNVTSVATTAGTGKPLKDPKWAKAHKLK